MSNQAQPSGSATAPAADKRIAVTLLTGFLGAGKTTLLNHWVKQPEMAGAALLINELGEVGIDHHLVDKVDETMVILDSGCICCSVQGDLVKALKNLAERSSRREIPPVTRVVVESTGLADPVPVVYTLTQDRFVAARYRCDGVITAVDATHAVQQLGEHREAMRQVAVADRLLITKCDLADAGALASLHKVLDAFNPGAARVEVRDGRISPGALFGSGIYTSQGKLPDVAAWLGEEQARAEHTHGQAGKATLAWHPKRGRGEPARSHATDRHGDLVSSFVIDFDRPVPWYGFAVVMGGLLQLHGPAILRVKGLMNIAGDPSPRVIQCVQDVAYPPTSLANWPEQSPFKDRRGRLVFIVHGMAAGDVENIKTSLGSDLGSYRPGVGSASIPLPTSCWLAHGVDKGAASAVDLDGWVVQTKRLAAG